MPKGSTGPAHYRPRPARCVSCSARGLRAEPAFDATLVGRRPPAHRQTRAGALPQLRQPSRDGRGANESLFARTDHGLEAGVDPDLIHKVADVGSDGAVSDADVVGDPA